MPGMPSPGGRDGCGLRAMSSPTRRTKHRRSGSSRGTIFPHTRSNRSDVISSAIAPRGLSGGSGGGSIASALDGAVTTSSPPPIAWWWWWWW